MGLAFGVKASVRVRFAAPGLSYKLKPYLLGRAEELRETYDRRTSERERVRAQAATTHFRTTLKLETHKQIPDPADSCPPLRDNRSKY